MQFELDNTLIDDIIFHMESQDGDFLLDIQEGMVINTDFNEFDEEIDYDDARYISLPDWSSNDGYRLMERFAASLKNPVIRAELSIALNRSRGAFRAYRDVLSRYPETEKQWYNFKEKEMKNEVMIWYNSLREEWGLEPIGIEPEDNTSLVLEDFFFKNINDGMGIEYSIIAETASGDHAGKISAVLNDTTLRIDSLEVISEYRGMGIGKTLLLKMLETADEKKAEVVIDVPVKSEFFSRSLLLENFKPSMQRFVRKI